MNKRCLICKKEFYAKRSHIERGRGKYCSRNCYGISKKGKRMWWINNKGRIAWNKGMKFPQYSGVNSPVWKGGHTKETIKRTTTPEWKKLRKQIYERDNWTCQRCLKHCHEDIQCHHIIPYRRINKNEKKLIFWNATINSRENLNTLCKSCHAKEDSKIRNKEKEGNYGFTAVLSYIS